MANGEIGVSVDITERTKGASVERIRYAVDLLQSMSVLIGIPEGSGGSGGMSNVELAYLHSKGSPVNNMPARPFIEPALEQKDVQDKIANQFATAFDMALNGDTEGMETALAGAGQYGQNAVRAYMGSGALAPNAPITISGGWMRNKVSGKPFKVKGKGSAAPLIDTGGLRASVTYIIEKGGGN